MLARMNFASTLASNQKFKLATAAAGAKQSPQALVNYLLARLTAADMAAASTPISSPTPAAAERGPDPTRNCRPKRPAWRISSSDRRRTNSYA